MCPSLVPFPFFLSLGLSLICIWYVLLNLGFFSELELFQETGGEVEWSRLSDALGGEDDNNFCFSKWKVRQQEMNMLLEKRMVLIQSL